MRKPIILVFVLLSVRAIASPSSSTYTLSGFPKAAGGCQTTADHVGQNFSAAFEVKVVATRCIRQTASSADIELRYVTEKPLDLVGSDPWPLHRTHEACRRTLEQEEKLFRDVTGLQPGISYCAERSETKMSSEDSFDPRFSVIFLSRGTPQKELRSLSYRIDDGGIPGRKVLAERILAQAKLAGLPVFDVALDAPPELRNYDTDIWVRILLPPGWSTEGIKRRWFLVKTDLVGPAAPTQGDSRPYKMPSLKDCEQQRAEAERTFSSSFSNRVVWFCAWNYSDFYASLYHLRIKPGAETFESIVPGDDGEPFVNQYRTHGECEREKPQIVEYYRQKLGKEVVGGLCSFNNPRPEPFSASHLTLYLFKEW